VKKIGRAVDMMAVVFAFEVPFYEKAGVPVRFVGHPLVDEAKPSMTRAQALGRFALASNGKVIGLFPGSRRSEIKRLMPVIAQTAKLLRTRFPCAQFVLPVAPGLDRKLIETYLDDTAPSVTLVEEANIYDVIQVCDAIITKSGTATLQIALMATPMVIIYKVSGLSYWIARRLVTVKQIGLANIVAGKRVAKEFIQDEAGPQAIAAEIECLITNEEYADTMRRDMTGIRAALGEGGGSRNVARLVTDMLMLDETV
jgi:lipid-A-disaccharide synthase